MICFKKFSGVTDLSDTDNLRLECLAGTLKQKVMRRFFTENGKVKKVISIAQEQFMRTGAEGFPIFRIECFGHRGALQFCRSIGRRACGASAGLSQGEAQGQRSGWICLNANSSQLD